MAFKNYEYFIGPLGWPYPLVNAIMGFILAFRSGLQVPATRTSSPSTQVSKSISGFHNIEKFKIIYDKETGDPIEVIVHRKVEANV